MKGEKAFDMRSAELGMFLSRRGTHLFGLRLKIKAAYNWAPSNAHATKGGNSSAVIYHSCVCSLPPKL